VSGFGACRTLLDVSLIHFVVNLLSQIKHILGQADQRAHASTFECVRLCSEGKIIVMCTFFQQEIKDIFNDTFLIHLCHCEAQKKEKSHNLIRNDGVKFTLKNLSSLKDNCLQIEIISSLTHQLQVSLEVRRLKTLRMDLVINNTLTID